MVVEEEEEEKTLLSTVPLDSHNNAKTSGKYIRHLFCGQNFSTPVYLNKDILSPTLATILKGSGFKSHFSCNPTLQQVLTFTESQPFQRGTTERCAFILFHLP